MSVQFVKTRVQPQGIAPAEEGRALQLVELCGRTAYKSEDKITPDSARNFVLMLKSHGHLSVLEHSNIVLKIEAAPSSGAPQALSSISELYGALLDGLGARTAYHRIHLSARTSPGALFIAGNLRSWIETLTHLGNGGSSLHALLSAALRDFFPIIFGGEETVSSNLPFKVTLVREDKQLALLRSDAACDLPVFVFKFVCDRGITHEVVRHRVLSFTQESTRYVNYKNKGMVLILPEELYPFYDDATQQLTGRSPLVDMWVDRAEKLFAWYREDLDREKPEIARDILPNLLKSEIFVSGRWSGWKHFVQLRDSKHAHPRIRAIAKEVRNHFDSLGMTVE